jgi:hypothetical protein
VVERRAPARVRTVARAAADRSPVDPLFHRGDLTFAGVVERLNAERLVLHTRTDGDPVDGAALRPNMRVFVLAGRNLDNSDRSLSRNLGRDPRAPLKRRRRLVYYVITA